MKHYIPEPAWQYGRKLVIAAAILSVSSMCPSASGPQKKQAKAAEAEFSLSKASRTIPPSVKKLVEFYVWGNGDDGQKEHVDETGTLIIRGLQPESKSDPYHNTFKGVRGLKNNQFEPYETISVRTRTQRVDVWIVDPAGQRLNLGEGTDHRFQFDTTDPTGQYSIVGKSQDRESLVRIELIAPDGPRTRPMQDGILLYNFQPNERVRLLLYQNI